MFAVGGGGLGKYRCAGELSGWWRIWDFVPCTGLGNAVDKFYGA